MAHRQPEPIRRRLTRELLAAQYLPAAQREVTGPAPRGAHWVDDWTRARATLRRYIDRVAGAPQQAAPQCRFEWTVGMWHGAPPPTAGVPTPPSRRYLGESVCYDTCGSGVGRCRDRDCEICWYYPRRMAEALEEMDRLEKAAVLSVNPGKRATRSAGAEASRVVTARNAAPSGPSGPRRPSGETRGSQPAAVEWLDGYIICHDDAVACEL